LRGPRGGLILCKEEHAQKIDKSVFPGLQGGPHQHNIAAKAVAFGEALQPEFKEYAKAIKANAQSLFEGMVEEGFEICFGKTENHLILADITPLGIAGKEAQKLFDSVHITLNKNMIPDDTRSPFDPSGIRVGTPAMTTRGFTESDFKLVGQLLGKTIKGRNDESVLNEVRATVKELTDKYPLYPGLEY
jgi:glycine hydroxymethyltransferase